MPVPVRSVDAKMPLAFAVTTLGYVAAIRAVGRLQGYLPSAFRGLEAIRSLPRKAVFLTALAAAAVTVRKAGDFFPAHDWVFGTRSGGTGSVDQTAPHFKEVVDAVKGGYVAYLKNPRQFQVNNARAINGVCLRGASPRYRLELVQAIAKESGAGLVRLDVQQVSLAQDDSLMVELLRSGGKRVFYIEGTYTRPDTQERLITYLSTVADWNLRNPDRPVILFMDPEVELRDVREGLQYLDLPTKLDRAGVEAFLRHYHHLEVGEDEYGSAVRLGWRDAERIGERSAYRAAVQGSNMVQAGHWGCPEYLTQVRHAAVAETEGPFVEDSPLYGYSEAFHYWLANLAPPESLFIDYEGEVTENTNREKRRAEERWCIGGPDDEVNMKDIDRVGSCLIARHSEIRHYRLSASIVRNPVAVQELMGFLRGGAYFLTLEDGFSDGDDAHCAQCVGFLATFESEVERNPELQVVCVLQISERIERERRGKWL